MKNETIPYGSKVTVPFAHEAALKLVREALADEGFGILSEIDVNATLKKKLDVDFRPYTILGACNPALANQALNAELDIGLLLPCNVVVYAADESGVSVVAAIDPKVQLGITGRDDIGELASQVEAKLARVLGQLPAEASAAPPAA